jgi:copper chaperone NosL
MESIPAPKDGFPNAGASSMPRDARWGVYGLVACALALFADTLHQPWWSFRLYAPQYPRGLTLTIALDGVSGDTREINMLNHYIGMAHLDQAAAFERQYAALGVGLLVLSLVGVALLARPAWSWLLAALGALLPVGFLADSFYWLYRFGHDLDPHAPVHLPGFTPQLFGNGVIGQFMTFARPERGFWVAVLSVLLLAAASLLRRRVSDRQQTT